MHYARHFLRIIDHILYIEFIIVLGFIGDMGLFKRETADFCFLTSYKYTEQMKSKNAVKAKRTK